MRNVIEVVHSRLNLEDSEKLERTCLKVILGDMNIGYEAALEMDTLSNRREMRSRPEKTASMQTMLSDILTKSRAQTLNLMGTKSRPFNIKLYDLIFSGCYTHELAIGRKS